MTEVMQELLENVRRRGLRAAVCSFGHVQDLQHDLEETLSRGGIDRQFAGERLAYFEFSPSIEGKAPASIIVTAAPQPEQLAVFTCRGTEHRCVIPPTYSYDTDTAAEEAILEVIGRQGYTLVPARLPLKLTAARTGLTKYGRNNIAYHEDFGSYFRLKAFLSDFPAPVDHWQDCQLMPQCETCTACVKACPTGAVTEERFIVRAERCLTYFNERPEDFPGWVRPEWHNCLIGCMRCQLACPIDKDRDIRPNVVIRFSEDETANLLASLQEDDLVPSVRDKLEKLWLLEDWQLIARNLKPLLG